MLDGKRFIFIGNSFVYYGQTVLNKGYANETALSQQTRDEDRGYFYELCRANGAKVHVTNWTFGGHTLSDIFGDACGHSGYCSGKNHLSYLTDRVYDYVVISEGTGDFPDFLDTVHGVMEVFRAANPAVKFVYLCHTSSHLNRHTGAPTAAVLNALKTLDAEGVIVVDWGKLSWDLINGDVTVPGGTLTYNKNSLIVNQSENDGYHPNLLAGYLTSLMTYCAITGENAAGQPYDFYKKAYTVGKETVTMQSFIEKYYRTGETTNFDQAFASPAEMAGLQQLAARYLAEKAYLNYHY